MYHKTVLKNGLRIITVPKKDSLSVNLLVLTGVGTNFETREVSGLSHFVEHMCFKGTKKRPRAIDISSELDSLGADYNAFTGREYTGYYVSCLPDKTDEALDILSDMYLNPIFEELEIEKEKGVIGEEINRGFDNPARRVGDIFTDLVYGDTPFGWSTLGTVESLRGISQKDFIAYRRKYYHAANTVVVAAGRIETKQIVKKIGRYFDSLPAEKGPRKKKLLESQKKPALKIEYRASGQSNMVLGFRSFGMAAKSYFAAEVLAGVLGGTMSSRLWQKVREEMGAAYSIAAFQTTYLDYGYLGVAGGIQSRQVEEVIRVILAETEKLKSELVGEKELARVKDSIVGTAYLQLETPADLGSYYGLQEVRGETILTPAVWADKIRAVTAAEVRALAKKIFVPGGLNLAILGPHDPQKSAKQFEDLLAM